MSRSRRAAWDDTTRPQPAWVVITGLLVALCIAGYGVLPLLHDGASHSGQVAAETTVGSGGCGSPLCASLMPGGDRDPGQGNPADCRTCHELLLAKLVVPWTPPAPVVLPERIVSRPMPAPESRPLPVELTAAAPRGPPLA